MKELQTETRFTLEQYMGLARGIRLQLNSLTNVIEDTVAKNTLAPILTKLLRAIERLEKGNKVDE
jgi:hypothetical protein